MNWLSIFQYLLNLGSSVLVPIVIFILGLIVGMRPGKALKSAILIGIAFTMINVLLGALFGSIVPASQAIVKVTHGAVQLDIIDIGWAVAGTIAFATRYGLLIIPVAFIVNFIMLGFKWTKTFNVDIWNFWHFAFLGAIVQIITGNFWLGLIAAILLEVLSLIGADLTQKRLSEFIEVPGVSFTTSPLIGQWLYTIFMDRVICTVFPFLKRIKITPEKLTEKMGIFGEAPIIGLIVGVFLGILARYSVKDTLQLAIMVAAIMLVFPRIVKILMEGLFPLSEVAKSTFAKRFKGREIFIGIDWIVLMKPLHIILGLLFIPITILLAFILPGMHVMPMADLPFVFAFVWIIVPYTNQDFLRSFILGIIAIIFGLYICQWVAPSFTEAAKLANVTFPEGAKMITNVFKGCDYPNAAIFGIFKLFFGR
jgi:PTS system galactitol-specific IIC component